MRLLILSLIILFGFSSPTFSEEVKDVGLVCKDKGDGTPLFLVYWFDGNQKIEIGSREAIQIEPTLIWSKEITIQGADEHRFFYEFDEKFIYIKSKNSNGDVLDNGVTTINRFSLEKEWKWFGTELFYECEAYSTKPKWLHGIRKAESVIRKYYKKRKI